MRFRLLTVLLLVFAVTIPTGFAQKVMMRVTVDEALNGLWLNEQEFPVNQLPGARNWQMADTVEFDLKKGKNVVAMHCTDAGMIAGLLVDIRYDKTVLVSDKTWKYDLKDPPGWEKVKFDDSKWKNAVEYGQYPTWGVWVRRVPLMDKPMTKAFWVWSDTNVPNGKIDTPVFFRFTFGDLAVEPVDKLATTWGKLKSGF